MDYANVYYKLQFSIGVVHFLKKDDSTRIMICTRNPDVCKAVCGDSLVEKIRANDRRGCVGNGNIVVIDLALNEIRLFNIDRTVNIEWFDGEIGKELIESAFERYLELSEMTENLRKRTNKEIKEQVEFLIKAGNGA